MDPDGDGIACESLPSAPQSEVVVATPEPTPVPRDQGTSRFNPYPTEVVCAGPVDDFCLGVASVDWDAWPEIQAENRFNDAPPAGHKFVMIGLYLLNHSDTEQYSGGVRSELSVLGHGTNVAVRTFDNGGCGVLLDSLPSTDVFPNGSVTGNVCFVADLDLSTLVMRWEPFFEDGAWYALPR